MMLTAGNLFIPRKLYTNALYLSQISKGLSCYEKRASGVKVPVNHLT